MAIAPTPSAQAVDPCSALLLNDAMLSRFAMEVARDIYDFPVICAQYGITEDLFNERIVNSTQFMRYFAEHHALWNSPLSATQRIAAKAGVVVEDFLRQLAILLNDPVQPMTAKVDAFKHLTKIAGVDNVNAPVRDGGIPGGGSGATVVINLNHGRQITIAPRDVTDVEELPTQVNVPPPVINMPQPGQVVAWNPHSGTPPPYPPLSMQPNSEAKWGAGRTQTVNGQPYKGDA